MTSGRGTGGGGGAERAGAAFGELVAVMARLRGEGGCPWDRQQTPASLRPYVVEEAYELLEAIDGLAGAARGESGGRPDPDALAHFREELGDLLLQVVFQAEIATERGWFTIGEVAFAIAGKLVRRHPHVFADRRVSGADEALANWEAIKLRERRARSADGHASALAGVPATLPALQRAHRISEKAARVGFDWPDAGGVISKVDEERRELGEAIASGEPERIAHELGDLLFALVNLGRVLGTQAEDALRSATARFVRRFEQMERALADAGREIGSASTEELDRLWEEAKRAERETAR